MQRERVIKWAHGLLTTVLFIAVGSFSLYQYIMSKPYDDSLYSQRQLTENIWLYVTEYKNSGATDSDVYRYYLNNKIDDNIIEILGKSSPFLTADKANAEVSGEGNIVKVSIIGRVYSFSNSAFFYDKETPVMPTIDFQAKGISAWK